MQYLIRVGTEENYDLIKDVNKVTGELKSKQRIVDSLDLVKLI